MLALANGKGKILCKNDWERKKQISSFVPSFGPCHRYHNHSNTLLASAVTIYPHNLIQVTKWKRKLIFFFVMSVCLSLSVTTMLGVYCWICTIFQWIWSTPLPSPSLVNQIEVRGLFFCSSSKSSTGI